ncbi:MAG: RNA polymerase sigma factor [Rubripirellula sp.]
MSQDPNSPADSEPSDDPVSSAWKLIFEESQLGLRAFLRGRLAQESDVDDCLQAVYVSMLQSGGNVSAASRRAWLFRVAANESAALWRKKASTDRMLHRHGAEETHEIDPANKLIQTETESQLRQALTKLPNNYREVIRLRMVRDLTFQEIANELNIPLGTALTRMRRALEKLREEIQDNEL